MSAIAAPPRTAAAAFSAWVPALVRPGWSRADVCVTRPLAPGCELLVAFGQDRGGRPAYLTRLAADDLDLDRVEELGVEALAAREGRRGWGDVVVCAGEGDDEPDAQVLVREGDESTASDVLDAALMLEAAALLDRDVLWAAAPATTHLLVSDDPLVLGQLAREVHAAAGKRALSAAVLRVHRGLIVCVERARVRGRTSGRRPAARPRVSARPRRLSPAAVVRGLATFASAALASMGKGARWVASRK